MEPVEASDIPPIKLDVVLESPEYSTDYIALFPRGLGPGGELITTEENLTSPEIVFIEDLCQAGCGLPNHRLCTQTDLQLVVFGPHIRYLCELFLAEAVATKTAFHNVAQRYLTVRPVTFEGESVGIYNPAEVAVQSVTHFYAVFSVTAQPHRLVVNIARKSLSEFTSNTQGGKPFRFEISTHKSVYFPISGLLRSFMQELHLFASDPAHPVLPAPVFSDETLADAVTPFSTKIPTTPAVTLFRGPADTSRRRATRPVVELSETPPPSTLGTHDPTQPQFAFRLCLLSHMFMIYCKNPLGRAQDSIGHPPLRKKINPSAQGFTTEQLWHVRPYRPTHASVAAAFAALHAYVSAHSTAPIELPSPAEVPELDYKSEEHYPRGSITAGSMNHASKSKPSSRKPHGKAGRPRKPVEESPAASSAVSGRKRERREFLRDPEDVE